MKGSFKSKVRKKGERSLSLEVSRDENAQRLILLWSAIVEAYKVGYKKPPLHSRFKPGICPNPKGRGKKDERLLADILREILDAKVVYLEGGKRKQASRAKLSIVRLVRAALKGQSREAAQLLRIRKHAAQVDPGPLVIEITGGLPTKMGDDRSMSRSTMKEAGDEGLT